jgi:hypothetical protein
MLFGRARIPYPWREPLMLSLGKTENVKRDEYKGFDERKLIRTISRYFTIEKICSVFPPSFPLGLSFTIGIVASSKRAPGACPLQHAERAARPSVSAAN